MSTTPSTVRIRWDWIVLLLIVGGGILRFLALGQQSYWVDEIRSVIIATGGPQGKWVFAALNIHGPLHLVLLKIWMLLFGNSEAATRSLSAIFGLMALPLFYRVAAPMIGRRAALLGLALLAVSPFHLWYSQEARNYAMLFDAALLAIPIYLWEIERRSRLSFLAALAISVVACLTNLAGFFILALYGLFAVLRLPRGYPFWRPLFLMVLTALLLSPWIANAVTQLGAVHLGRPQGISGEDVIVRGESPAGVLSIPFTFYIFSLGFSQGPSIHDLKMHHWAVVKPFLPYLVPVLLLFGVIALRGLRSLLRRSVPHHSPPLGHAPILVLWLFVPLLLMLLISMINLKAPNPRYAIVSFAPFVMLLGLGLATLRPAWVRAAVTSVLLLVSLHSVYHYFTNPYYWRPDGRAVGALLDRESTPSDIAVSCGVPEPLELYAPNHLFVFQRPPRGTFAEPDVLRGWLHAATAGKERLWYVKIDSWWGDPAHRLLRGCQELLIPDGDWQFEKAEVHRFRVPPAWREQHPVEGPSPPGLRP
ncbi:MAG: hypothetical protein GF330_14100 [Candidatus Eisenbacteria bacterium]|nr:hypothetical protein [Candidatus Eisenbacteria bacterium]